MTSDVSEEVLIRNAHARLDDVASGLHAALAARSAMEHEQATGTVFALLKETRATTMLIPSAWGGRGASAADAVRFQVALGSMAPSAAIATTMHHYKIAALGQVATSGDERAQTILRDIARGAKLIASGGAESTPGRDLRNLRSQAVRDADGYRVTGMKQPCSLSTSMDLMSLMVELCTSDGSPDGYAQAFVDARAEGVEREPFWHSPVFLAAESHAVRLCDVPVPQEQVFPLRGETGGRFATDCYIWFQLLISASYLGIACCLAEATPRDRRVGSRGWTEAAAGIRHLEASLLDAARAVDAGAPAREQLNLAVRARDWVEDEIGAIGVQLLRAAGGGTFARTGFYTMIAGGLNAIAFHPPQRGAREGVGLELLDPDVKDRD
ncbi:isobutylamine N-hydroxylase [Rhodococcus rhodochrous]|uniref:acyl-CoA dehydrogenase family protein n=1 Tax=Rhodococcus rhodochrous TaxID=1829 RepID=UPI0007508054|nr:acyl-CoA dehydrogenase family protein [Rhodococcus rhodochrous]MDO1486856.1 acyl-CoA/acyl-ACP dehydrogenase [Rhodococcus rhodochrous]SNV28415.1 isobutylamine N-hydroxylase [Rhodococcus rhodochrous]